MKDRWEDFGYRLCYRGDWISDLWSRIWFHWYCPYPVVIGNSTAKRCVQGGYCGCSNARRTFSVVGSPAQREG